MDDKLKEVYSPAQFKKLGYELVDMLSTYLENAQQETIPANNYFDPADQFRYWKNYQLNPDLPTSLFKDIIDRSIQIHHPKYMGHQVCAPAPIGALASLVSSVLNNGQAIYEMGGSATAMEKVVVDLMVNKVGYDSHGDGFLTSGGTLGNLTALLTARQQAVNGDVWENGLGEQLGVMVSAEAHYSVDRAVRVMGLGAKGIIKIPAGKNFSMQTDLLDEYYEKAKKDGIRVIAVVGCAPSTSTGMHDDLEAIGRFCQQRKCWFHVDGAHGGAAVFSNKYKPLLKGIEQADSIVIDGHKMLMTPALITFVLYKNKHNSFATFRQKAEYLLDISGEEEWYNGAKRTMECTKLMMGMKFYAILKIHGEEVFGQYVTLMYDLGKTFAEIIAQNPNFELALMPDTNIVCFRWVKNGLSTNEINVINARIRETLLRENEFYVVQTSLNNLVYMRTTLMNPFTNEIHLKQLLSKIEAVALEIYK